MYGAHRALIERAVSRMDGHIEPDSVWGVTGWLRSLDLPHVVATALQPPLRVEPFTFVQKLSRSDLDSRLAKAQLAGLAEYVWTAVQALRDQQASTAAALSAKFATEGEANFQMELGSLSTYFGGLEGLIGGPKMHDGDLEKAMELEHCHAEDSDLPFSTSNKCHGATSRREWEFVVKADTDSEAEAYVEREGLEVQLRRRPTSLTEFEAPMAELNDRLASINHEERVRERRSWKWSLSLMTWS